MTLTRRTTSNALQLIYLIFAVFLLSGVLIAVGVFGLFSDQLFRFDENVFRYWNVLTSVMAGMGLFTMGYMLLKIYRREHDGLLLIDWLSQVNEVISFVRYPISSDILKPIGEALSRLFPGNRGWILLAQVPGLLISGEAVRRKYLQVGSGIVTTEWDTSWAESQLRMKLGDSEIDRLSETIRFPNKDMGHCGLWIVKSRDGDLAVGVIVALSLERAFASNPFFNEIISTAIDLLIKRLGVLLVDVVDRREKMGNEGLGLVYRMLVHEMSRELQGIYNTLSLSELSSSKNISSINKFDKDTIMAYLSRVRTWMEIMKDAPLLQDNWAGINPISMSLDQILKDVIGETHNSWPDVTFVIKGTRGLNILADNQVRSVIRNIAFNAGSFSPEEGVVTVSVSQIKSFAQIQITDEGPGVSEEVARILFDTSVPSEKRPNGYRGMGVGLILARIIARAFGGEIVCIPRKEENDGGKFVISLPLSNELVGN